MHVHITIIIEKVMSLQGSGGAMEEVGVERGRSRNDVNIVVMHKIKKLLIKKNTAFFPHKNKYFSFIFH